MVMILGIDPGSRKTGFGLINASGNKLEYVSSGTIRIDTSLELPERLKEIFVCVSEVISLHSPQEVAVEKVFMARSADSALKLGQIWIYLFLNMRLARSSKLLWEPAVQTRIRFNKWFELCYRLRVIWVKMRQMVLRLLYAMPTVSNR
jgi:Holliday junction resolvasome RuvABC endonuclease subunit